MNLKKCVAYCASSSGCCLQLIIWEVFQASNFSFFLRSALKVSSWYVTYRHMAISRDEVHLFTDRNMGGMAEWKERGEKKVYACTCVCVCVCLWLYMRACAVCAGSNTFKGCLSIIWCLHQQNPQSQTQSPNYKITNILDLNVPLHYNLKV